MPCSRCGARFRSDPSCGKTEHDALPRRRPARNPKAEANRKALEAAVAKENEEGRETKATRLGFE